MNITDGRTESIPFFVDDIDIKDITSTDFDPYASGSGTVSDEARYLKRGFLIRPAADGDIKVVTWAKYKAADEVVVDTDAVTIPACLAGKWEEVKVVKVFSTGTTTVGVAIGIIL